MKITKSQLKRIIKEELARITEYSEEAMRAWDRALRDQNPTAARNWLGGNPGVDVDPPAGKFKLYAPGDDPFNDWVEPMGVYDTLDALKDAWEGSYVGDREDMMVVKPGEEPVPAHQVPELGGYAG